VFVSDTLSISHLIEEHKGTEMLIHNASQGRSYLVRVFDTEEHKRTAWGCGRIPNAEKLAIIWAKMFKIWAKYTATFTCK